MRSVRPDLVGISGSAIDGATSFEFPECRLISWPSGAIIVEGNVRHMFAEKLAEDVASALATQVVDAETAPEILHDNEPTDLGLS